MSDEFEKWINVGKLLGLSGESLQAFVEKQQVQQEERNQRAYEREQQAREHEREARELERREAQEAYERELQRRKQELEMKEREAALQREAQEREMELLRLRADAGIAAQGAAEAKVVQATRPKLPKFDEATEDIDAFIERFERFAQAQKWPVDTWAVSLSPLLTGK